MAITPARICDLLFKDAPQETAESWDNVGLLCGREYADVTGVLVSLDVTLPVLQEAEARGCNLIVAHHPVVFGELSAVTDETPTGKLLLYAITHGIACIGMHTNFDKASGGVNDLLAARLGLQNTVPLGEFVRIGTVEKTPLRQFAQFVKERLGCPAVQFFDGDEDAAFIAVGGGACADEMADVVACGCDTFVTSDVKYHQFLDAKAYGLNLIDAGHFYTERLICERFAELIHAAYPELPCFISAVHSDPTQFL